MNVRLVTRYPLVIRFGMLLVCALLAVGLTRGAIHAMTIIVTFGAVCLTVAVLAYRAEINDNEVRVRYAPFYTRRVPVQEIVHLVEGKTLILVTTTRRLPLWGASDKTREALFQMLPHHLDVTPSQPSTRNRFLVSIRKHRRWTIVAGVGFLITAALVFPFFKGNALHEYWSSVGQYLLLLCLLLFIAFIFEAGFTWVLWSTKREADRIENPPVHRHH